MEFLTSEEISMEVKKILASERFVKAERISTLLRWIVENTLLGEVDRLKEAVITHELYESTCAGFVRNLASRLRVALAAYYGTAGASDPIVVVIPPGHYKAVFLQRQLQR